MGRKGCLGVVGRGAREDMKTVRNEATLTLAHSPDPDDAFMWWPLTGKIAPDGTALDGDAGRAALKTGRIRFRALPVDIESLNRRAVERADLDITALSARRYAAHQARQP